MKALATLAAAAGAAFLAGRVLGGRKISEAVEDAVSDEVLALEERREMVRELSTLTSLLMVTLPSPRLHKIVLSRVDELWGTSFSHANLAQSAEAELSAMAQAGYLTFNPEFATDDEDSEAYC